MSNNDGNLVDSPKTPDGSADFSKPLGPYAPHTSIEQVIPAPSPFGRFVTTKPGTFSVSYKGLDTVGREIAAKAVKSPEDIERQEKIATLKKNLKQIEVGIQAIFKTVELSGLELNYGDDSKNQTTEELAYLERVTLLYSQLTEQNPDFQEIENQANNIKEELRELESIIRESLLKDDARPEIPTETQGVPKAESTTPDSIVENRDPGTTRARCSHVLKMIDSLDANFDQSESNSLHNWGSILKDFLETPSQGSHTYIEKLLGEAERLLVSVASRNTSASPIHLTSSPVLSTVPSTQIPPEQDPALQMALANNAAQAREIVDLESKNQRITESQTLISNFSKLKTGTTIELSRKKESADLDSFINELNTREDKVQELITNFNI